MKIKSIFIFALSALLIQVTPVSAERELERSMNFQGRIVQNTGVPLVGSFTVKLEIFEVTQYGAGGGILVWDKSSTLTFENGFFATILDNLNQTKDGRANVFEASIPTNTFEIQVTANSIVYPRIPLRSVASSINATRLQGKGPESFLKHENYDVDGSILVGTKTSGVSVLQPGQPGQFLRLASSESLEWATIRQVPAGNGSQGEVLTHGPANDFSWQPIATLPSHTAANQGHFLRVNSANSVVWEPIFQLPDSTNAEDNTVLVKRPNGLTWETPITPTTIPPNDSNLTRPVLTPDASTTVKWTSLDQMISASLAEAVGSLDNNVGKVLGIVDNAGEGELAWLEVRQLPSSAGLTGKFSLEMNRVNGSSTYTWKTKTPVIYFQANCTTADNANNSQAWKLKWVRTANMCSNENTTALTDNAITLSNGDRQIDFDYANYPGIYRVDLTATLQDNISWAVNWHIFSTELNPNSNNSQNPTHDITVASMRFSPAPFPYQGSTVSTSLFVRVETQGTRSLFVVPDSLPNGISSFNSICIRRIGDIPQAIDDGNPEPDD